MGDPFVIPPGGGEVVGDAPDRRVEILCEHDALHATWSRFGPGRDGADLHVHRRHTDLFYVLEGELTVRLGPEGEAVAVPAGTLARVPPLVVHGFRNASDAEVRYLNFHAPGAGIRGLHARACATAAALAFDQEPPPADGAGRATEARRSAPRRRAVAHVEEIAIAEVQGDRRHVAARPPPRSVALRARRRARAHGRRPRARAAAGTWVQVRPASRTRSRGRHATSASTRRVRPGSRLE